MKTLTDRFDPLHRKRTMSSRFACVTGTLLRTAVLLSMLVAPFSLFGQEVTVTGRITDEVGEGIPGVNIAIKGTAKGTSTDLEGRYTIKLSDGDATLVISSVGFSTVEEHVGKRSVIDVQLMGDFTQLNEVVVTGYSTLRRKDISSSIAVVDVDDMKKIAASNIGDQLQGKVAGVQVSTSGDPGSVQYVRVRGIGTINNNEPLYVIDGIPVQNETNMNFLNPNDIESMQVLKDAAAASIYGARAANGVIVITTKKGRGTSKLKFDFFTGTQQPQNLPQQANSEELLQIRMLQAQGAGQPFESQFYIKNEGNWVLPDFLVNSRGYAAGDPAVDPSRYVLNTTDPELFGNNYPIAPANKQGTNWMKEMFQPASILSAQLSSESGDEKGRRYFSINYYQHDGILIENKWRRFQTRLNSEFFVGKKIRIGENINIALQSRAGQSDWWVGYDIHKAFYNPTVSVNDIMGYWATSTPYPNPVADQVRWASGSEGISFRLTGNAFAEYDFLNYFTVKSNVGLDYNQVPKTVFLAACPECSGSSGVSNTLTKDWTLRRSWVFSTILNFDRSFEKHKLSTLAGIEIRDSYREGFNASGTGLKFGDDPYYRELNNAQSNSAIIGSSRSSNRMVSAFFSANYTFNDRYILLATVRTDGSSRFVNDKYGVFPGFSAAWRISQESFLSYNKFITEFKLRASWGITGNNEVVGGDYPGISTYGTSLKFTSYPIRGVANTVQQGFAELSAGNPDLKWETSTLVNIGFDATLIDNLDLTVEWYTRRTDDMIYAVVPPLESGIPTPVNRNIGSMLNKGIDAQLTFRGNMLSRQLLYTIGLTGTHYTNKVLRLDENNSIVNGPGFFIRTEAGYPVSQFYGFITDGLWQSQQQIDTVLFTSPGLAKPGRMKFKDLNEDGSIDNNDRTFIGSPIPKFIMGLNLSLNYKNFDLTAYVSGVFGKQVCNILKGSTDFGNTEAGFGLFPSKRMLYEAGETLPVLDANDTYSGRNSSYWVEDGSFVRMRSIVLGYTLANQLVSKVGIAKLRIYFQAQNLFTWTRYTGMDPDVTVAEMYNGNAQRRDLVTGVDYGHYPTAKQFIIGLNIEF